VDRHLWRAFQRGLFLFTTNVRPRRRTSFDPGRSFNDLSEFLIFIKEKNGYRPSPIPSETEWEL